MTNMQEFQEQIVQASLASLASVPWRTATFEYREVAKYGEATFSFLAEDGTSKQLKPPSDVVFAFSDLRDAMATPAHGTWISAVAVLRIGETADFDFNYDEEPEWDSPIAPEIYLEDLDLYPRPADEVPSWHPGRKAS